MRKAAIADAREKLDLINWWFVQNSEREEIAESFTYEFKLSRKSKLILRYADKNETATYELVHKFKAVNASGVEWTDEFSSEDAAVDALHSILKCVLKFEYNLDFPSFSELKLKHEILGER